MTDTLKEFYSSSLEYMASLEKNEKREYLAFLEECAVSLQPSALLLECGCGLGHSSYLLSSRGFSVTGTDISPLFIAEARKKYGEGSSLRFLVEDAARMSFPDQAFDAVCSALFLEHVSDVEGVLHEMSRVLKKGGRLVIAMPNFLDPFQHLSEFISWQEKEYHRPWEAGSRASALYQFFKFLGIKLAKAAGLNHKIYYLQPVLSGLKEACGNDFDASWLANHHDVEGFLRGLGIDVSVSFPETGAGGRVVGLMRRLRLPEDWRRAYEETRASGFTVTALKR